MNQIGQSHQLGQSRIEIGQSHQLSRTKGIPTKKIKKKINEKSETK